MRSTLVEGPLAIIAVSLYQPIWTLPDLRIIEEGDTPHCKCVLERFDLYSYPNTGEMGFGQMPSRTKSTIGMVQKARLSCTQALRAWYLDILPQLDSSVINKIYSDVARPRKDPISDILKAIGLLSPNERKALITHIFRKWKVKKNLVDFPKIDPLTNLLNDFSYDELQELWMKVYRQCLPKAKKAEWLAELIQILPSSHFQLPYSHLRVIANREQLENARSILEIREKEEDYENGRRGDTPHPELYLSSNLSR
ncbi:hypothetical protein N7478_010637 [Penicillium angulare]|uniref:uncharacterized protein n=1 Tax=Penicillium angulare TaxID=116970 RepID=UPI00253F6D92|nr:uncharacterized protein N7478_010637 [Penicillium angulare]KAJ5267829.1 hypothetical protein N7478_010637 [Penicillium angulare]